MSNDNINGALTPRVTINGELRGRQRINGNMREGGGTSNYEELENLPAINGVELIGDKSAHDLGLALLTDIPETIDYSTTEQNTGVKWIDGKDIFCRTFTGTFTTGNLIIATITPSLSNIISMEGFLYYQPNNQWLTIPYGEGNDCVTLLSKNDDIIIYSTNSMSSYSKYIVTIFYTKGV